MRSDFSFFPAPAPEPARAPRRVFFRASEPTRFDRGRYGTSPFALVQLDLAGPRRCDTEEAAPLVMPARLIRRFRRCDPSSPPRSTFVITTCALAQSDEGAFLAQFDRACEYMRERAGFVGFWMFEATERAAPYRFINIAKWRSFSHFESAFGAPEFKWMLRGGFDARSQIIVTQLEA